MKTPVTMDGPPIGLTLPRKEPKPVPGCEECAALDRQRSEARRQGDMSQVSDCNVLLRQHSSHSQPPPRRPKRR